MDTLIPRDHQMALQQKWRSANRVLYHVADAPAHGLRFHTGVEDDFPGGHPEDTPMEELLQSLMSKQISYYFGKLHSSTDKMVEEMNLITAAVGRPNYVQLDDITRVGVDGMMVTITDSLSSSIFKSISSSARSDSEELDPTKMRSCVYSDAEPDWETVPTFTIHKYIMTLPSSIEELVEAEDDFGCVEAIPIVKRTKVPPYAFSKGALRAASKGMEISDDGSEARVVHKESLSTKTRHTTQEAYEKDMAGHRAATFLAQEFNKAAAGAGLGSIPRVEYVEASVCQYLDKPSRAYFSQEGLVHGTWEKYNSNAGFVEPIPSRRAGVDHSAVQCFTHWTYEVTNGEMMTADCQGAYDSGTNTFRLTDPAIHSKALDRFDKTNLGGDGMNRFFRSHVCNDYCRSLSLAVHHPTS